MLPSHENFKYSRRLLMDSPLQAPSPHPSLDSSSTHDSFSSNLTMIVMMLLCALICSFCMNLFIKCVFKCINATNQEPNLDINTVRDCGLDKRALKTFPVVKYSKEVKIQGLATECVICLQEFGVGEKVRILPKCNHGFHVKCIDKWLTSHTTCPTCRQSLSDTCQKIIGCDNQVSTSTTIVAVGCDTQVSSSTTVGATEEAISIDIAPLENEDLVRN